MKTLTEADKYYLDNSQETFSILKYMELANMNYEDSCKRLVELRQAFEMYQYLVK